jgi:hypothetical protein
MHHRQKPSDFYNLNNADSITMVTDFSIISLKPKAFLWLNQCLKIPHFQTCWWHFMPSLKSLLTLTCTHKTKMCVQCHYSPMLYSTAVTRTSTYIIYNAHQINLLTHLWPASTKIMLYVFHTMCIFLVTCSSSSSSIRPMETTCSQRNSGLFIARK